LSADIELESFYAYGYQQRSMIAVRAPSAMANDAAELVGRVALIAGRRYRVLAVARQITGPVAKGEPIGIEVSALPSGDGSSA
jgi:hypothetical protein